MTAGLAHEVRNPLNAAKLQLELLERRLRKQVGDLKALAPVGLAHHEIERLTELLNEFLSFARPAELHSEEHDVVAIARHVVELEKPFAERSGATLTIEVCPDPAVAIIDPGKVHQVVQNLVRNGIEAAGTNGHVSVGVAVENGALHIRVRDDGCGIPDAIRSRIYEPFFSTKEGGTGMGMAIVHNFVAMHGGKIDIESSASGTLVDVAIPRR
jgi:two-component system, NtrC family, sensor histidine kinase HydH